MPVICPSYFTLQVRCMPDGANAYPAYNKTVFLCSRECMP
ncbi:hypothetical protein UYSO10_0566 [Kosakonia radicincitans]|uniref:Uncharacterized protein n=1 Tax=Kosakonia oryziphila TaxID=1005667 RepID=A0A1C4ACZ6_9ENTR|nr:hypothetical protein GA0061070_100469 [Kosakonia oryziphila]SKC16927.1 hypothetical protein SAMN05216168_2287 [Kosakonia radicincitans]VVT45753.1 hypothetical protein UYSO10_0566 [Kosakonia radicincitans]